MEWETVIGLEIHVQLATKSKIFSGSTTSFGAAPNTQASLIDLGFPGVLPVVNKEAVRMAALFGLAIQAEINTRSVFERKNYFYPDLPKGYQISQAEIPIVSKGSIEIQLKDQSKKIIDITRAHLEEDAGKSMHEDFQGMTGVDLNRAGTPLLEIVSEPVMHTSEEAVTFLKAIHTLIQYLKISDGNMAEGSMRCDANVSIKPKGQSELGTRTEIKNINSFRFVEKAIDYEIERQIDLIEGGGQVTQETRLYNAEKNETRSMRSKEDANDYRYFPDPDLLPVYITEEFLESVKQTLPELPKEKTERFKNDFNLSEYDANLLTSNQTLADYFEACLDISGGHTKLCANWISSELMGALNKSDLSIEASPISTLQLGTLIKRIADNTISGKIGKSIFEVFWNKAQDGKTDDVDKYIEQQGLKQVTDQSTIEAIIQSIIEKNPKQVDQYRSSDPQKQKKLIGFFVGQVMKASQGKANPGQVNQLLVKML